MSSIISSYQNFQSLRPVRVVHVLYSINWLLEGLIELLLTKYLLYSNILLLNTHGTHSGKTTILYRLQIGEVVTTIPTIGFNVETVSYKNIKFQVWDLGGQTSIRPYWRCYYADTKAVVYVVDSSDRERIGINKQELLNMLGEEELKDAKLLVFANKQVSLSFSLCASPLKGMLIS